MTRRREEIDETDRRILDILTADARSTLADIGSRVLLSTAAVKRRIDRLERSGVIRGYTTAIDHEKLGQTVQAFAELRFVGSVRVDEIDSIADSIPRSRPFSQWRAIPTCWPGSGCAPSKT
jgi:Lrp/AsnC family transcriptional regulator, leucine-responsive regulatory protein